MLRICLITIFLFGLVSGAAAQSAASSGTPTTRPTKGAPPKAAPNSKQAGPVDAGACDIGLISATADRFGVQQVGFTMFGNEYTPVAVDGWGLDDLIMSRVRAAASGKLIRRIAYSQAAWVRAEESGSPMRRARRAKSAPLPTLQN